MDDKDREGARKFLRQLEDESNVFAREVFVTDAFERIRAEAKAEVAYGSHVLYKTGDVDAPAQIKDANGDVCIGMCRNCGRAESELSEVCDHRRVKAEALREAVRAARAWKWPNDGTGRHDLFNRGVEAACAAILADEPNKEKEE